MNCAECKEQLVLHVEQLLDDAQERQLAEHLERCRSCQAELRELEILQGRLVRNGEAARSDLEDQVMNRIIREQNVRLKSAAQASAGLRLRRLLMKSPMTRIAAAAVVVVSCVLAFSMWRDTGSIVLADVLAKVEQIQAYLYRENATTHDQNQGDRTLEATVLTSNEYGVRTEQTTVNAADGHQTRLLSYLLPRKKSIVILNLTEKQYGRRELDDATLANMKTDNRDPREMIKRFLACQYSELGTAVIDGVTAQGFATTDPAYLGNTAENLSARLWVDVETWLPVRYELEMDVREGVRISVVQEGYQWDIPVVAGDFEPDIPADFTADQMDGTPMPSYSDQGVIEALRIAADFTGRYPETLGHDALQQLVKQMTEALNTSDRPAVQQFREELKNAGSREAAMRVSQGRFMKLMTLTMFPLMLGGQGAEPVYHGDVVTPSDAGLPLMRWKVSDGQYRVIFGDLHAETVTADVLTQLEAALPQ